MGGLNIFCRILFLYNSLIVIRLEVEKNVYNIRYFYRILLTFRFYHHHVKPATNVATKLHVHPHNSL